MKKLIKKSVLFLGTVCLCFLCMLKFEQSMEVQAAYYTAGSTADLVRYCATMGDPHTITQGCGHDTFSIQKGGILTISNTTGIDADSVSTLTMSAGKIVNNTTACMWKELEKPLLREVAQVP